MPEKYTTSEEKARILTWRQEDVSIKLICECMGKGRENIMRILAPEKHLCRNTVPNHKFGGGRKKRHHF